MTNLFLVNVYFVRHMPYSSQHSLLVMTGKLKRIDKGSTFGALLTKTPCTN